MRTEPGVAVTFLRWTCLRAVFHRGYVLASGLYFVTEARLTAPRIVLLGIFVAIRFPEDNFTRVQRPKSVFRNGLSLTRHDPRILLMLAATTVVNGAGMTSWLFPRRLVELGLPGGPVLGYTAVGIEHDCRLRRRGRAHGVRGRGGSRAPLDDPNSTPVEFNICRVQQPLS